MNFEYTCPKPKLDADQVYRMYIVFDNGDFIMLTKREIQHIDLHLYDRLIESDQQYSPVAESGYIECRIAPKPPKDDYYRLYNRKEYKQDRKAYIENRCTSGDAISCIRLFNKLNWHQTLYGDVFASLENDRLIFRYRPNDRYGSCDSDQHTAFIGDITKKNTEQISLDFENCDSFDIFEKEILNMHLVYDKTLEWNSSGFGREVIGGYILLKLDPEFTWRKSYVYCKPSIFSRNKLKHLEDRLFALSDHRIDICHLYVTYKHHWASNKTERIYVRATPQCHEIRETQDDNDIPIFFSGYVKKQKDGTILIRFGDPKPPQNKQ